MIDRFSKSNKTMRHAIMSQIPAFYNDEGPGLVAFVEKYFQHLEDDVLSEGRTLQETGDIDTTAEEYLIHFNNKYTFGAGRSVRNLPSVITGDIRFLIKHIKDIYRSKGTYRSLKLFFRVAFNDDPEIFTPGEHLFRASDATFIRPDIIEIDDGDLTKSALQGLPGTRVQGSNSGARATVDSFFTKRIGQKTFNYLSLSNITGTFVTGDQITTLDPTAEQLTVAPKVTGPVNDLDIVDGNIGIPLGTLFTTNDERNLKVSATGFEFLSGTFDLSPIEGTNYSNYSDVVITRAPGEVDDIERGQFSVSVDGSAGSHDVSGSIIASVSAQTINSTVMFGAPLVLTSNLNSSMTFSDRLYGSITTVPANVFPQFYTKRPFVRVEDIVFTSVQQGTVTLSNTAVTGTDTTFDDLLYPEAAVSGTANVTFGDTTVYGIGTAFTTEFNNNDVIRVVDTFGNGQYLTIKDIKSDTEVEVLERPEFTNFNAAFSRSHNTYIKLVDSLGNETIRVVNNAVSNTELYLDDKVIDSDPLTETANLTFCVGYSAEKSFDLSLLGPTVGRDADFEVDVVAGEGSVKDVYIINSGFGFEVGENVQLLSEDLTPDVSITSSTGSGAEAYVTIENEEIVSVTLTNGGSGYETAPVVTLVGGTGAGATFTAVVSGGAVSEIIVTAAGTGYRKRATITARPIKGGQSILEGRAIKGNNIRVQDSDFWQEYSYEIRSSIDGSKYEEVVDGLLHMAGRKMFTRPLIKDVEDQNTKVITDSVTAG